MDYKKQEALLNQFIDKQNPITENMTPEQRREALKKKLNDRIYYKSAKRFTNKNKEKIQEKMQEQVKDNMQSESKNTSNLTEEQLAKRREKRRLKKKRQRENKKNNSKDTIQEVNLVVENESDYESIDEEN